MELPQTRASSTDWLNDYSDSNDDNASFENNDEISNIQLDQITEDDMNALNETSSNNKGPSNEGQPTQTLDESDDIFMNPSEDTQDNSMALFDTEDDENKKLSSADDFMSDEHNDDVSESQSMDALLSNEQLNQPLQTNDQTDDIATFEETSSTTPSLFERIRHFFTDSIHSGMQASNQADTAMVDTIRSTTNQVQTYTITYFVMKLFLLACVIGYTASINVRECPCANNFRKPVILIGGGIVMVLCLLAMVMPQLFTWMPFLKAFLMTLTFVILYCIITYFPLLRNSSCECSKQDWRRWLVEGIVYITIAMFVLTLLGIISM